jgi:hypothetical protein
MLRNQYLNPTPGWTRTTAKTLSINLLNEKPRKDSNFSPFPENQVSKNILKLPSLS